MFKEKIIGSWIWTSEKGQTVQTDTNEYSINIYNCPEKLEFREIIQWETIWEFELDGDFEEKLSYNNWEHDLQASQDSCFELYENYIFLRENNGIWELENNNQGLEIKQRLFYADDSITHDYIIISVSEDELVLEKDDLLKTKLFFMKRE